MRVRSADLQMKEKFTIAGLEPGHQTLESDAGVGPSRSAHRSRSGDQFPDRLDMQSAAELNCTGPARLRRLAWSRVESSQPRRESLMSRPAQVSSHGVMAAAGTRLSEHTASDTVVSRVSATGVDSAVLYPAIPAIPTQRGANKPN